MNRGGHARWPLLGMTPMVLLVLGLHLQGSAARCIDTVLGEDLQPLPPGVQRCSLPSGLLQPDVPQPGQGGGSSNGGGGSSDGGGGSRIVGGSPAVSGSSGGSAGGGSAGVGLTPQGGEPYRPGGPNIIGPFGRPIGPIIAGGSSQSGGQAGSYGSGPQYGAGPGQYGNGAFGYGRGYGRYGHLKPVAKPPGIPYIPSAREWGGGHIPVPRDSPFYPNAPYAGPYAGRAGPYGGAAGPYGGAAGSYGGAEAGSTYSGEPVGPRGRYDGSYGPIPIAPQPGDNKVVPRLDPCKPNNEPC